MLNIQATELDTYRTVLAAISTVSQNIVNKLRQNAIQQGRLPAVPAQQAQAQAQAQQQPTQAQQPPAQPAPLNQANLEDHNRVLGKTSDRSNSKSGATPAAPTSTQPPFPLHAASPHGQPAYIGKPSITQDNLQLPATKRRKVGGQPGSAASAPGTSASPQSKPPSPDIRRQAAPDPKVAPPPPKPVLLCLEPDCDMSAAGFLTEEARQAHIEEEHTKPNANPLKFVEEQLAETLGLDPSGHAKRSPAGGAAHPGTIPMVASASRQGQTPASRLDASASPMSRAGSMNRQGSAAGVKPSDVVKGALGKAAAGAKPATPKLPESSAPAVTAAPDDLWGFVDPQDLTSSFGFQGEIVAQGAISDFSVYRNALTPNDTPESKEDSGASEPNSDIPEGAHLDIDVNFWTVEEPSLLEEMHKISMSGGLVAVEDNDAADFAQAFFDDPSSMGDMDGEFGSMFDKPNIELDTSMYFMDTMQEGGM